MVAVLGGWGGLGAGTAFVGRAVVVVVVGGGGLLGRGIAPSSLSSDDSKENFRFLGAGWGGLGFAWGGGGGRPPPPSSPSLTPPPPMLPHISSLSPPPRTPPPASEPTPRAGSGAAPPIRRSPRAKSPNRGDHAREQGRGVDPGPRCDGGPPRVLRGSPQRLATPPGWAWHSSR